MEEMIKEEAQEKKSLNFIEQKVEKDLAEGKNGGRMQTRFPPEPNGYLHIGHAKAIALDFGLAKKYGGVCNLRFDDTNPQKEDTEYMDAIEQDIRWLGFEWGNIYYASDYFQQLWDFAVWLIRQDRAYVDEQSAEVIAQQKGTTTSPGTNSPFRNRPVEESLRLFDFMNSGKCEPGTLVLRAKIDMVSKRNLLALVKNGFVSGWDDPRMPTICAFRRRGYSPESIVNFIDKIGYTTYDALNDFALLESAVREDLNQRSTRVAAVVNPVKLVITNYPEGKVEELEAVNNPERPEEGTHTIEFSRELWIERDDFQMVAEKKFMRLAPGKEVRLKNAYIIKCNEEGEHPFDVDAEGNVTCIYATYDPETRSGQPGADRKIKGKTLHWLSCAHCLPAEVRMYERLWRRCSR